MAIIEILVDGKVTLTVPATVHSDGTIWSIGQPSKPVINGALAESRGIPRSVCTEQVRTGNYTPEVLACGMVLGENFGGRFARDRDAAEAAARDAADAAMSPIDREKRNLLMEIARVEKQARTCDRSEDDVEYQRLRGKAQKLQNDFYTRFPEEKAADQVRSLRSKAEHIRGLAAGAMVYDCDGTLSYKDQCRRRDEMLAEATTIDSQADEMEGA